MKPDDVHTSPDGHSFRVLAFDSNIITVEVERTVRKGGMHSPAITEKRRRVLTPGWDFDTFAQPYTLLNGKKKAVPSGKDTSASVRRSLAFPKNP